MLRTTNVDNNNKYIKRKALIGECPKIRGEEGFIILLNEFGIVFIEVKYTTSPDNVKKGKEHLEHTEYLLKALMPAITLGAKLLLLLALRMEGYLLSFHVLSY